MSFEEALKDLREQGLNIFLSAKVSDLPENFFPFTPEQQKKTLCLIGHGGKGLWSKLPHPLDHEQHPIDQFSIQQMRSLAKKHLDDDIEILFPHPESLLPLQRLGRFFHLSSPSPLGMDISSEFGLWFAFRGLFLTAKNIPSIILSPGASPCETCLKKPCLSAMDISLGRLKCPVKAEHRYSDEQRVYHQDASKKLL